MEIKSIDTELAKVVLDPQTGIKLVKMTGDSDISIYAAEIAPNTELKPHYHLNDIETYQILEGQGKMRIAELHGSKVVWESDVLVTMGDFFSIEANQVHQIVNHTDERLLAIFSCPESHVGSDRFFV